MFFNVVGLDTRWLQNKLAHHLFINGDILICVTSDYRATQLINSQKYL